MTRAIVLEDSLCLLHGLWAAGLAVEEDQQPALQPRWRGGVRRAGGGFGPLGFNVR